VALPAAGIALTGPGSTTTRNFLIKNIGKTGNLIGTASMTGASTSFTISQGPLNIAPRGSTTETVTFTPGTTSTTNIGTLVILSNDAINPIFNVTLRGRGFPGRLVVPASFIIRATTGGPTVTANLTIRNAGRGLLSVSWPTLSPSPGVPYSATGGSMDLQPSTTFTIPISFTATAKGRAPTAPFPLTVSGLSTGARSVTLRGIGD
jgi:hypothetical protein